MSLYAYIHQLVNYFFLPQRTKKLFLSSILFLGIISNLSAQEPDSKGKGINEKLPWKTFQLNVGAYFSEVNSTVQLGEKSLGVGVEIDLEKALNLSTTSIVLRGNASFRLGRKKRNILDLGRYEISRKATQQLSEELVIMDSTYSIGTSIKTNYAVSIISLKYGYSFFMTENFEAGASLGMFIMPVKFSINTPETGTNTENFTTPLPTFGVHANFILTPKIKYKQDINFLFLKFDDFSGKISDINIGLEYDILSHLGLGLNFNLLQLDLEATETKYPSIDFVGHFGYQLSGVLGNIYFYF